MFHLRKQEAAAAKLPAVARGPMPILPSCAEIVCNAPLNSIPDQNAR